jgi:aerobic-type carbon monoxide dehydrogenase small subunit (CoxS/CutS family)
MPQHTILFTLHYLGNSHRIQTFPGQYHSLMSLISDNLAIPGFGLCCGMGSCGTCLVQIIAQQSVIKRNVLSCSTLINDDLSNTDIMIPDKIY